MKIKKIKVINVDIPLDSNYSGSTYEVRKRCAIVTQIFTSDGLISEVFSGDDRFRGNQTVYRSTYER